MQDTPIINISGYRFVHLNDLADLQTRLKSALAGFGMQGSIMLASEGINVSLAGTVTAVKKTREFLDQDERLLNLWLKETVSTEVPYRRLRVRVRTEIIAFDGQESESLQASRPVADAISAQTLKRWLDEKKDITLLDARNDYEIVSGTFPQSTNVDIKHFRNFKTAVENALEAGQLDLNKPLVTYCTGGIRCEKAAPWLLEKGFTDVCQLDGGLLNYFAECGSAHWEGDCFIFDDRVELTTELKPTGAGLCDFCQLAVPKGTDCRCQLGQH